MSILSALRYSLGPPDDYTNIYIALALVPAGAFFDLLDGKVARWRGKSSLMGQELDSLADLVCSTRQIPSVFHSKERRAESSSSHSFWAMPPPSICVYC